jgi:hypothetical protein
MGRFCKAFYFHVSIICVANSAARGDLKTLQAKLGIYSGLTSPRSSEG